MPLSQARYNLGDQEVRTYMASIHSISGQLSFELDVYECTNTVARSLCDAGKKYFSAFKFSEILFIFNYRKESVTTNVKFISGHIFSRAEMIPKLKN